MNLPQNSSTDPVRRSKVSSLSGVSVIGGLKRSLSSCVKSGHGGTLLLSSKRPLSKRWNVAYDTRL
jgi:hypothetical protein